MHIAHPCSTIRRSTRLTSVLLVVLTIDVYFTGIIPPPLKKLYRPISGTKLPTIQQPLQNPEISQVDAKIRDQTALLESNTQLDKVAIIVPYKNRSKHLLKFLTHMLPFLRKQRRRYVIIIIEQAGNESFNRAKLFNVAVKEIRKSPAGDRLHGIDCFILHDVDKVPTSSSAVYTCGQNVRQLVNAFRSGNKTRCRSSSLSSKIDVVQMLLAGTYKQLRYRPKKVQLSDTVFCYSRRDAFVRASPTPLLPDGSTIGAPRKALVT
ncbi:unnamed protein product [Schistocephalus solidus]|uniref:Glyco_transf_7N domain-containing protein n=1 Tax=Schistocephalus solidus TaxID=70667 RepID=A0A183TAC3_SCHSO|nr:unnamed protein product [Schistocephalus solidus]